MEDGRHERPHDSTATAPIFAPAPQPASASLLARARSGDRESFAELVRLHQRPVRAYLGRLLGDWHLADDLAQDVFLDAFRGLEAYRQSGTLLAWLLGMARNKALSQLRAAARRRQQGSPDLESVLADVRWRRAEADSISADEEQQRQESLRLCLGGLSPKSRQLVESHYFQGRTAEAIAAEDARSGGAVRMALLRIRESLRECIESRLASNRRAT